MEHEISAVYDVTHGAGLAVIFPAWLTWMASHHAGKVAQYAERVWDVPVSDDKKAMALEAVARLKAFFRSIGQKKHGEKFTPNWNKVLNERGRAHFKFVEYKDRNGDDRIKNEVDRFLDYDASLMPPDTDTASSAEVDEDGFMKIPDGIADELPFD